MDDPGRSVAEDIDRVVLTEAQILIRIAQMGRAISRDYANRDPLLVGVLKGVILFMADLLRQITIPVTLDFMAIPIMPPMRALATSASPRTWSITSPGGTSSSLRMSSTRA